MVWEDGGCKAPSYPIWKGTCEPFVSLMLDIASKVEEEPTEGGRPTEDRFIACLRYPRRGRGGLWDVSRKNGHAPTIRACSAHLSLAVPRFTMPSLAGVALRQPVGGLDLCGINGCRPEC